MYTSQVATLAQKTPVKMFHLCTGEMYFTGAPIFAKNVQFKANNPCKSIIIMRYTGDFFSPFFRGEMDIFPPVNFSDAPPVR